MLSISAIRADEALGYYNVVARLGNSQDQQQSNYYVEKAGQWYGRAAKQLRLAGNVSEKHFVNLVQGRSKSGRIEIMAGGEDKTHRAGLDFTFSAPKSVSILAEVAADAKLKQQIYDAHETAVKRALDYVEQHYSFARQTTDGVTSQVATGNLAFALFTENTSRSLDPQIHTHAVIFNMTHRPDGKWRALSNEALYDNKMFLGQIYRNELAKELTELNLQIETKARGLFELKGMPQSVLAAFSERRGQIEQVLAQLAAKYPTMSEAKLREKAALFTRTRKRKNVDLEKLRQEWQAKLNELGWQGEKLLNQVKTQAMERTKSVNQIDQAIGVLTVTESAVSRERLLDTGLKQAVGKYTIDDLNEQITTAKTLRTLETGKTYTSQEILYVERCLLKRLQQTKNSDYLAKHRKVWFDWLPKSERKRLTQDQANGLRHIFTNPSQVVGIQGDAGTGKTYMLHLAANQFERDGFEIVPLAPTAKAVAALKAGNLNNAQTIDSYLLQKHQPTGKPKLFIIDEASMLGSKKLARILEKVTAQDKLVLVGDNKQKQSIEAGGIFTKLYQHQIIPFVRLAQNIRQKDKALAESVTLLADKKIPEVFQRLQQSGAIEETTDPIERMRQVARRYAFNQGIHLNTLAIVQSNAERKALNAIIRQQLLDGGHVSKHGIKLETFRPKTLPPEEKQFAYAFDKGDRFYLSQTVGSLPAGTRGVILKVDHARNTAACRVEVGQKRKQKAGINLTNDGHKLNLYQAETKTFALGDQVVCLKNDKSLGLHNGTQGRITGINRLKNTLTLKTEDGQLHKFSTRQYQYFDYGYAQTDYKVQGQTTQEVIYLADARAGIDYNSFYVAATRGTHHLQIITNDKQQLMSKVQNEQTKTSTLDYELSPTLAKQQHLGKSLELQLAY